MFHNGQRVKCKHCSSGTLVKSKYLPEENTWFLIIDLEGEHFNLSEVLEIEKNILFHDAQLSFSLAGIVVYDKKRGI